MKWFKWEMPFAGKNLRPSWIFKTSNLDRGLKIWRLLPAGEFFIVELRDTEKKITMFARIEQKNGKILWSGNPISDGASVANEDNRWWITMNQIYKDVLFLQQFARPDMPTPGKVFALDILTGKLLWQNIEISLIGLSENSLYGLHRSHDLTHGFLVELDYRTGEEEQRISLDDPHVSEVIHDEEVRSHDVQMDGFIAPEPIEAHDLSHGLVPSHAINPSVIQLPSREIIGYYSDAGKDEKGISVYDACIMITGAGKRLFGDVADHRVSSALHDFFFVANDKLIYLRNSNEIVAVPL